MPRIFSRLTTTTTLLFIFLLIAQITEGFYLARRIDALPLFTTLRGIGLIWAMFLWLKEDSRKHGVLRVLDLGLFLFFAWPLIMLYYLFKTRRAMALLTIFIFSAVYLGAMLAGAVLSILLFE